MAEKGTTIAQCLKFFTDRGDGLTAAGMPSPTVSEHDRGEVFLVGEIEIQFLLVPDVGVRNVLFHRG